MPVSKYSKYDKIFSENATYTVCPIRDQMQMHSMFNGWCTTHTTVLLPCTLYTSSDVIQSNLIFCLSKRYVKHKVMHISFLHEYALWFKYR
jgi:hypothetical protein